MPLRPRLARALSPTTPCQPRASAACRRAVGAGQALPHRLWTSTEGVRSAVRSAVTTTAPRRRPHEQPWVTQMQSPHEHESRHGPSAEEPAAGKPSIFEELFPGEARILEDGRSPDATTAGRQRAASERPAPGVGPDLDEVHQWLRSEMQAATGTAGVGADEDLGAEPDARMPRPRPRPTVLVLSGTTPSLLPSDFFRIAPRVSWASSTSSTADHRSGDGDRVDGWAAGNGGIYKIVQDRDPATLAPRGRYFLYFGSSAAALAYAQEVRDLHTLAHRAVQPPQKNKSSARRRWRRQLEELRRGGPAGGDYDDGDGDGFASLAGSISTGGAGVGTDAYLVGTATEEEMDALRRFTLVPPTARLDLAMQMPPAGGAGAVKDASDASDANDATHGSNAKHGAASPRTLYEAEELLDDAAAADATTKVLVVLEDTSTSGGDAAAAKDTDSGGVATVAALRRLIKHDGVYRNLPWAVSDGLNGVVPVRWLVAEQKRLRHAAVQAARARRDGAAGRKPELSSTSSPTALWASRVPDLHAKTDDMHDDAQFSRFVVAFADAVEARRFVRSWHRRTVPLPARDASRKDSSGRTAVVDATVLW